MHLSIRSTLIAHRLMRGAVVELMAPVGCKPLIWRSATLILLDTPPLDVINGGRVVDIAEDTFEEVVDPVAAWPVWPSTGFLER